MHGDRRRRTAIAGVPLAVAVGVLSSCSGSPSSGTPPTLATPQPTVSPVAAPTDAPTATAIDAVTALGDAQLPVESAVVYDAETDPGHQLGRPGGYRSRAAFVDARLTPGVQPASQQGDIEVGGSVEVYETAAAARAAVAPGEQPDPVPGEHDVLSGNVLLRLAPQLTPEECDQYRIAMQELTGEHATTLG